MAQASAARRPAPDATASASPLPCSISVLAERTGVSVPSIHHYRRLGLLAPPVVEAPNRYRYDSRHLTALLLIKLLRDRHRLSLPAISEVLPRLLATLDEREIAERRFEGVIADCLAEGAPTQPAGRLVAAARTAFAERGYAHVNVGDLCDTAGVAKGSFYRYFDSKEDIFVAAARSTVDAVAQGLAALPCPASDTAAIAQLEALLEPLVPLLLEVATREMHGEQESVGVVATITEGLTERVGAWRRSNDRSARSATRRVVEVVLLGLLRPTLGLGRT